MRMSADLPRCRFLGGACTVITSSWCRTECDPFWRLYRNRDPGAEILHAAGRLALEPGSCYLVPAWTTFKGRSPGAIRHDFVHFQVAGLPGPWLRRHADQPIALVADPWWGQVMERIGGEVPAAHLLRLEALLCAAVAQALAGAAEPPGQDAAAAVVAPALALAEGGGRLPATVAALARLCGVGPDHLARCFARANGQTPARWLNEQRIARAAADLVESHEPVAAVATRHGFANPQHFCRVFRRITGSTPAGYRRRLQSA